MKGISVFSLSFIFSFFLLSIYTCYKNPRFNALSTNSNKDISQDLDELYKINEELVTNEKEDEDEDDDEEEEGELGSSNFYDAAHESLEKAEEQATVDLENAEIENLLDEAILFYYNVLRYIGKCRREYSNICPLGWKLSAYDTSLCIPPETYQGQSMDFSNSADTDKELFAWKCEVEWPCISSPKLKVMAKCPFRWTHVGNNLCIAPEDYDGKCSPAMDFSNYDYEMRIRRASNIMWNPLQTPEGATTQLKKLRSSTGGPIEEDGHVVHIVY
ncbi:CPW-WPC family protein [Plasmodium brasilianum]|uniref:CPW-WPC family protein n=1 Tax=Plasmodium brasilianum TaxID=5824 RepID=A0ACB9Y7E4_PLABR|nr:CPW-WPC family protein [Plasmodium brasilianum]